MFENLSDTDRGLFLSCLKSWEEIMSNGIPDTNSVEYKIFIFTLALSRLTRNRDFLKNTYTSEETPESLRRIIGPFIREEISLEETKQRLEYCVTKLEEWKRA